MNGSVLKEYWKKSGLTQKELADQLGITISALGQQFNSSDLRSGTIEKFCDVFRLKINTLYEGTEYAIKASDLKVSAEQSNVIPAKTFDNLYRDYQKMLQERDEYKDLVAQLKLQISDMQRGMTIKEIAQKEAV